MLSILALFVLAQTPAAHSFKYTITGGMTEQVDGKLFIAAGLLEPLGYRVQSVARGTVKATGYGHTIALPIRTVRVAASSENTSDLVPLDAMHDRVKERLTLVRRSEIPNPTNEYITEFENKRVTAVFNSSVNYKPRPLSKRRWFTIGARTIPGPTAPAHLVGATVGKYKPMKNMDPSQPLVPDSFVSVEVILHFDKKPLPSDYSKQRLPLEAFALRLDNQVAFPAYSLMNRQLFTRTSDGRTHFRPTWDSIGPEPDIGPTVRFWIPPDRRPVELVFFDGRTLLRTKLSEIKGPVDSTDPLFFGEEELFTESGKKFRYDEIFKQKTRP